MTRFVDLVDIKVRSGDGGDGLVAWRREKYEPSGGPAGGDGGAGGHVILIASAQLDTLLDFKIQGDYSAQSGQAGGPKCKNGKAGQDLILKVPAGTVVLDAEDGRIVADLLLPGEAVTVACGGAGGRGNAALASSTARAPHFCEPGKPGIARQLRLELKLIADVGITGLPNAGKSTLLAALTAGRPKIAAYPFTTLEPNLGALKIAGGSSIIIADLPGLIEGACQGAGLGRQFLRHSERVRLLIHLVDISHEDPVSDISTLDRELSAYSSRLAGLPQLLVLNKEDLLSGAIGKAEKIDAVKAIAGRREILVISGKEGSGLAALKQAIVNGLQSEFGSKLSQAAVVDSKALQGEARSFEIKRRKNIFTVKGDYPERLARVTNLKDPQSVWHFNRKLKSQGVIKALHNAGAKPGSQVIVGSASFTFGENLT